MIGERLAYLPEVEWEGLQRPYEEIIINQTQCLPPGIKGMTVRRDATYRLQCTLYGVIEGSMPRLTEVPAGSFGEGMTITGMHAHQTVETNAAGEPQLVSHPYSSYELSDCHITALKCTVAFGKESTFTCPLIVRQVRRTAYPPQEAVRLVTWYLNGPRSGVIFPRMQARDLEENYSKKGIRSSEPVYPSLSLLASDSSCFASVSYGNRRFLIFEVPKGCGPEWSSNIGIEYRPEWGGIPEEPEREAISEIVGFVMGRRLIEVGCSAFNSNGWPVDETSQNPWGDNVVSLCAKPDRPPIRICPVKERHRLETVLEDLIPSYLAQRDILGFKTAAWQYWIGREATPDVGLMSIAAAVEGLAGRWLRSNKSKTQGVYLPKHEYEALTRDEFIAIKEKLGQIPNSDFILRTLEGAFEIRGVAVRRDAFLTEIGLPVGPVEREAFKARHPAAHGASAASREEWRKMIRAIDAYSTAFERILLKLLGYSGTYIDYTAPHHPETPLDQPLAGWPA